MATYKPTTCSGYFGSGANAYDGSTTTYSSGTNTYETWQWGTSLTGMSSVTVYVSYTVSIQDESNAPDGYNGYSFIQYSWDGTNWASLWSDDPPSSGSGQGVYRSFALANVSGKNLNTLRLQMGVNPGGYTGQVWDQYTDAYDTEWYTDSNSMAVFDIYADVSTGTQVSVVSCIC